MMCLRSMCEISRKVKWKNEGVRRRFQMREESSDKNDRKILKWFGHVKHMSGEQLTLNECTSLKWRA